MKTKHVLFPVLCALLFSGCVDFLLHTKRGNGDIIEQNREVTKFSGLHVSEAIHANVKKGDSPAVKVKTDSNLQKYIEIKVRNKKLYVGVKDNYNLKPSEKNRVTITYDNLTKMSASSSGRITSESTVKADDMALEASSAARITLKSESDVLKGTASSSATIVLTGSAEKCNLSASSAGNINGGDFMAKNIRAEASSAGNITITAQEELNATASSGGNITYYGEPGTISVDESSGGNIKRRKK